MSFLPVQKYFDDLFEKLVDIHDKLDYAEGEEKSRLIDQLLVIRQCGDTIYKQWEILQEYINILSAEYRLEEQGNPISTGTSSGESAITKTKETTNEVFWVADEESITKFRKGLGYFELLMYEDSVSYFQETVERDPEFVIARVYLGMCHMSLGRLNEAEAELKRALMFSDRHSPYYPLINHVLGCIYAQKLLYDLAIQRFTEVIAVKPDFKNVYFNLGAVYYNQKKYTQARDTFRQAIASDENDWEVHYFMGKACLFLTDFAQAMEHFKRSFAICKHLHVGLSLGKSYELLNQTDKAIRIYQQLREIYPAESELYYRFSWIAIQQHQYDQAALAIKQAISLHPRNYNYLYTLGWIYLQMNQFEQAENCFNFLQRQSGNKLLASIGLTKIYSRQAKHQEAKAQLYEALKQYPKKKDVSIIAYHLGHLWLQNKQYRKASYCFKASLKHTPYMIEAKFYLNVIEKMLPKHMLQIS